ncbi:hypothetical protein TUM20983_00430 [Mycobacterium antarcticum]|nr:hypothetical protein TUM20983_00430 [Mycolicibacterium sp. TUM20983]
MFRRPPTDQAPPPVPLALTDAFFDMDKRQSIAESAVKASEQLFPERGMRQSWNLVANVCYAAAESYLTATAAVPASTAGAFDAVQRQLAEASQAVDQFYGAHRTHLQHAQAALSALPDEAQRVATAANVARQSLRTVGGAFAGYPSVRSAGTELDGAMAALDSALAGGTGRPIRDATARVRDATAALEQALTRAPEQDRLAAQSLASVTTRMAALSTRAEGLAPAFSSLLREFNAASSEDLLTNELSSRRVTQRAAAELAEARIMLSNGNPEGARELASSVRAQLAQAEELVDAVTDRLTLLRSVRDNPRAVEDAVRFKLRDAQMLAVSRGVVAEWASVLDAQLGRIDRVVEQLARRNPDYWGYVRGLDAVSSFISGVVARMRTESPDSSGAT